MNPRSKSGNIIDKYSSADNLLTRFKRNVNRFKFKDSDSGSWYI